MMLLDVLFTLFLTHVGHVANVRKQPASLRSDSGPLHRNTHNDTLASEEAVLRSAITQLGWDDPPIQRARPEDGPREEVEITENGHTYLLRDGFVFEDGEEWEDAEVDIRGNGAALVGIFKGKSVKNVSLLPFTTIKRLFHYIE